MKFISHLSVGGGLCFLVTGRWYL